MNANGIGFQHPEIPKLDTGGSTKQYNDCSYTEGLEVQGWILEWLNVPLIHCACKTMREATNSTEMESEVRQTFSERLGIEA